MKKGNIISSIILICLSIYIFIETKSFPGAGENIPGPGFFPRILAIFLICLSLLLIVNSYLKKEDREVKIIDKKYIKVYLTILVILIYLVLLNILGFILATPLLLFALILMYGMESKVKNIIISILVTGVIYGVFQMLLAVPLPQGMLLG